MKRLLTACQVALLFAPIALPHRIVHAGSDSSAESIVSTMMAAYAQLRSYQDEGELITPLDRTGDQHLQLVTRFVTYFVRPNKFRFDWSLEVAATKKTFHSSLWWDGTDARALFALPGAKTEVGDIGRLVAKATGGSFGCAHTLARVFIPQVEGFRIDHLTDLRFEGERTLDGVSCYVVSGRHPVGYRYELWIAAKDHLLRRLRDITPDSSGHDEIHRGISINHAIADEVFATPPTSASSTAPN
jgi:hypothetical protein